MSGLCFEVSPLSRVNIRGIAAAVRGALGATDPFLNIVDVLDQCLYKHMDGYSFEVLEAHEMGSNEGLSLPDERRIFLRDDVYTRACDGNGRDRQTGAHELGHLVLHTGVGLSRAVHKSSIPTYRNSEWQAETFAGELLAPPSAARQCGDARALSKLCGISLAAASVQWSQYQKEGLLG